MSAVAAIKGMVMPVPTPFLENGEVDEKVFEELLDFYLASGVNAFFINGSYGQGPAMTVEQRKRTAARVDESLSGERGRIGKTG